MWENSSQSSRVAATRSAPSAGSLDGLCTYPSRLQESNVMEVYACYRPINEVSGDFYSSLPPYIKAGLRDLGLCHYMAVFRTPTGKLVQFDFGPRGGDMVVGAPGGRRGPGRRRNSAAASAAIERLQRGRQTVYAGPGGEIREEKLADLPATAVFLGTTRVELGEVRSFNARHDMAYHLNRNDCRHYMDRLVKHVTGTDRASAVLMRKTVGARLARGTPRMRDRLVQLAQVALEKEHTEMLARAGHLSFLAAAGAGSVTLGLRSVAKCRPLGSTAAAALAVVCNAAVRAVSIGGLLEAHGAGTIPALLRWAPAGTAAALRAQGRRMMTTGSWKPLGGVASSVAVALQGPVVMGWPRAKANRRAPAGRQLRASPLTPRQSQQRGHGLADMPWRRLAARCRKELGAAVKEGLSLKAKLDPLAAFRPSRRKQAVQIATLAFPTF